MSTPTGEGAPQEKRWAVQARGLGIDFGTSRKGVPVVHALHNVSLQVAEGALTAVVGPDGAGKTTLLRLMAGLMLPGTGELAVLGLDPRTQSAALQSRISYMPQRFGLYEDLTVQENLDLYADLHGVPAAERRERYARLLHMTDLTRFTARLAGQLSGGMKQKLGLACTLVRAPDLLLLDEPTVGVDPLSRRELWEIVQRLLEHERMSVIVSTSYLDEAERCDQVVVLHEGCVLAQGRPADLRAEAEIQVRMREPAPAEPPRMLQARLMDDPRTVDAVPQGGAVRWVLGRNVSLPSQEVGRPVPERLEDAFMFLLWQKRRQNVAAASGPASDAVPTAHVQAASPATARTVQEEAPVIEVRDLVRAFGDFVAVDHTTFQVRRGEIFGLLGPNGAGKTTTFRMLCGLLPATSGTLRVAGVDLRTARAEARRRIGYVAQKFSLYGDLTVRENLTFFGGAYRLFGHPLQARIEELLTTFGLREHDHTPTARLPGGYRQRMAMAAALLHRPEILFLDEPTSGADPLARRDFWRRITALAAAGTTVVVTTHFMEEAEYCDRILIQDAGRMLALGTPAEVRARAAQAGARVDTMDEAFIAIVEDERRHAIPHPSGASAASGESPT